MASRVSSADSAFWMSHWSLRSLTVKWVFFFFNFLENQIKSHSEVVGRVHVSGEPGGRVPELHLVPCVSTDISCRVSFTMIL